MAIEWLRSLLLRIADNKWAASKQLNGIGQEADACPGHTDSGQATEWCQPEVN
jgi:hypothetical protein